MRNWQLRTLEFQIGGRKFAPAPSRLLELTENFARELGAFQTALTKLRLRDRSTSSKVRNLIALRTLEHVECYYV